MEEDKVLFLIRWFHKVYNKYVSNKLYFSKIKLRYKTKLVNNQILCALTNLKIEKVSRLKLLDRKGHKF